MSNDGGASDPSSYDPTNPNNWGRGAAAVVTAGGSIPIDGFMNPQGPPGGLINSLTHGQHDANLVKYKNSIWNDDTLDEASKIRLQKILDTTGTQGFMAELQKAKEGKDIYGVFKKNSELLNAMKDRPGRSQTILTQGASAMTGQQPTGLLTDLNKR